MAKTFMSARTLRIALSLAIGAGLVVLSVSDAFSSHRPTPVDAEGEPTQSGSEITVTTGTTSGIDWEVTAFRTTGDTGTCMHVDFLEGAHASSGGCGFTAPTPDFVGINQAQNEVEGITVVFGPVHKLVAKVEITLSDGRVIVTNKIASPTGWLEDFYGVAVTGSASVTQLVALDVTGAVLQGISYS